MNQEIQDITSMVQRWREWGERQITGENDDFLVSELIEKVEIHVWPRLMQLTIDDNEFNQYRVPIWDEVLLLAMLVEQARLERLISLYEPQGPWAKIRRWVLYG